MAIIKVRIVFLPHKHGNVAYDQALSIQHPMQDMPAALQVPDAQVTVGLILKRKLIDHIEGDLFQPVLIKFDEIGTAFLFYEQFKHGLHFSPCGLSGNDVTFQHPLGTCDAVELFEGVYDWLVRKGDAQNIVSVHLSHLVFDIDSTFASASLSLDGFVHLMNCRMTAPEDNDGEPMPKKRKQSSAKPKAKTTHTSTQKPSLPTPAKPIESDILADWLSSIMEASQGCVSPELVDRMADRSIDTTEIDDDANNQLEDSELKQFVDKMMQHEKRTIATVSKAHAAGQVDIKKVAEDLRRNSDDSEVHVLEELVEEAALNSNHCSS